MMSCSYITRFIYHMVAALILFIILTTLTCSTVYADSATMQTSSINESLGTVEGVESLDNDKNIFLNLRGVELKDALSVLALEMDVNIILLDPKSVEINFEADNMTAMQALELIVQSQELSYLQNGQIIVVGPVDKLKKNFFSQMILTRFNLFYVTASEIKSLLVELGLEKTAITLINNQNAIWVQGTAEEVKKAREIIYSVDTMENLTSLEHKTLLLTQISPSRAVELLTGTGVELKRYILLDNRLLIFDPAVLSRWDEVQTKVKQLDIEAANKNKVLVFQLKNIVAGDAAQRLKEFGFSDIKTITYNNDRFGHEIMVVLPPYLETQIRTTLDNLDQTRQVVKVPILTEKGKNAYDRVKALRELLSEISDVPESNMHISRNLSRDKEKPEYVLWVEETPDRIQLLKELLDQL